MVSKHVVAFFLVASLVACAGASSPPLAVRDDARRAVPLMQGAKHKDLIYISEVPNIEVYSYPDGAYVGQLAGTYPWGLCGNAGGDVYVVEEFSPPRIDEYAHGAGKPKRTLQFPGYNPTECAVDPASGDLAVMSGAGSARNRSNSNLAVWLFPHGKGRGHRVQVTGFDYLDYACYDNKGDLFITGQSSTKPSLAELPKGAKRFESISLDEEIQNRIRSAGPIQWSTNQLAISNGTLYPDAKIDRISIDGTKARFRNETSLGSYGGVGPFWIEGNRVVASVTNAAYIWRYPKGGKPLVPVGSTGGDGLVVSLARQ